MNDKDGDMETPHFKDSHMNLPLAEKGRIRSKQHVKKS